MDQRHVPILFGEEKHSGVSVTVAQTLDDQDASDNAPSRQRWADSWQFA
jgi:hypothetical protein